MTVTTTLPPPAAGTMADRRTAPDPPDAAYRVGGIIRYTWGYDQTNVDWYRITRRTESKSGLVMLTLLPLAAVNTDGDGWRGHSIPGDPTGAPAIRRKLHRSEDGHALGVAVESYGWGQAWDGTPAAWSADR